MRRIILASESPRRKRLLKQLDIDFEVVPSEIEEKLNPRLKPKGQAELLSKEKAKAVAAKYNDAIIIAADTIIALEDEVLVKPQDGRDARRILKKLSGKVHTVITGFTILDTENQKKITKSVETKVFFKNLQEKEIRSYIEKENLLDKAGAYAIQGIGVVFVEKIEGDYFNVVGLPLFALARELKKFGITIF